MAKILVCHLQPLYHVGGAQSVCMNVLDTLQDDHNISLFTYSNPKIEQLNSDFNTNVSGIDTIPYDINKYINIALGSSLKKLRASIILKNIEDEFDLVINTKNTLDLNFRCPSIHYIHSPSSVPKRGEYYDPFRTAYHKLCDFLYRRNQTDEKVIYLSNSNWTGEMIADRLESKPTTLYPPVSVRNFDSNAWRFRKEGILTIGRINKEKNILRNIEIVNELRNRNKSIEYSIIGPLPNNSKSDAYLDQIRSYVQQYDYIHLYKKISREKILEMLSTYKYGLHGKEREHFGIVVAEYIAGGMIPFVPDSGGQVEIVKSNPDVTYCSKQDAVNKIEKVIDSPTKQTQIKKKMPNVQKKFGRLRFQKELNDIVENALSD